jgi:intracellular sulfur oxidation DsrE/DsrF family protein
METTLKNKIEEFLKSLNIDNLEITDFIDIENIDLNNPIESIYNQINDNGGFNIEIIYYSNAIQYLQKNDPSLNESLNLAAELCYEVKNLNSEILASLLASQTVRNDFYDAESKISNFFEELQEEEQE